MMILVRFYLIIVSFCHLVMLKITILNMRVEIEFRKEKNKWIIMLLVMCWLILF